jgi:hypothetical protein
LVNALIAIVTVAAVLAVRALLKLPVSLYRTLRNRLRRRTLPA